VECGCKDADVIR